MALKTPQISVVIPSYNRKDCVLALLSDLRKQKMADFEVIVVDDCSPDDSVAAIREHFPEVRILSNDQNRGPAFSRNQGIRSAKGEYIAGFDSDVTLPDSKTLQKIVQTFGVNPDTAGLAFRLFQPDGSTDDAPRWWHPQPLKQNSERAFETDYFSGTAYAFRTQALHEAGLYPEWLYMHYEEVVLAWRVLDTGKKILYSPTLTAIHHANPVSRRSEIEVFYKPRNQVLLAIAILPLAQAFKYLIPRLGFQFIKSVRGGHFSELLRALRSAIQISKSRFSARDPLKYPTIKRIERLRQTPQSR